MSPSLSDVEAGARENERAAQRCFGRPATALSRCHHTMCQYILVVDDDEAMCYALSSHLEGLGYEVGQAYSGTQALKEVAQRLPDLILLDVVMHEMSGWEVLEILHNSERTHDIRVLILTALGDDREEAYGWYLGCDWYEVKQKPLQFDDLELIIERLLAIDPQDERRKLLDT